MSANNQMIANNKMNLAASPSGQVFVLICVSLVAIMGMIAVVTDFSFLQDQRNMMQTAADSAAKAGSEELNYGDQVAAGRADAASNGYTNGVGSVTVAINNPPSTGPNGSNSAYVEAIVTKPELTYFLRALGISTITVSARAVAYEGSGPNCIYVLDPSATSALSASGSASIQSGCGVVVDSSASNAIALSGSASISAATIGVVGGYVGPGSSFTPTPKTGVIAPSDPLAYLQAPTVGSCAHTNFSLSNPGTSGAYFQVYAGTYCGGITISNGFVNFNAGTYVLAGGGLTTQGGPADDGHRNNLLQHHWQRRLQGNQSERRLDLELQRADLGRAGGRPVFSGSLDTGPAPGAASSAAARPRPSTARSTSRRRR